MSKRDFYEILGVNKNASADEIKKVSSVESVPPQELERGDSGLRHAQRLLHLGDVGLHPGQLVGEVEEQEHGEDHLDHDDQGHQHLDESEARLCLPR